MSNHLPFLLPVVLFSLPLFAQAPEPDGANIETGVLPTSWPASGPKCMEVPDWLVHEYNPNLYIIRQSGCLDYEKPFVFLLFGRDRGLLLDTGSRNFPAAAMLQNVAGKWLQRNHRTNIEIVVVHTHPHSDHTAGDEAIRNLKNPALTIKLIPGNVEDSKAFYGVSDWPAQTGTVDLGGRLIDAIPIPGHSPVSIALYDRNTAILFTGDSLYPGRLYVNNWDDFVKSTRRLVDFTKGKLVSHVIGNHIEQTRTAYLDYPVGTIYQPNEHALGMSRGDLLELMDALSSMHTPARLAMRDFSIWPVPPDSQMHDKALKKFQDHEKDQVDHMWNQP